MTKVFHAWAWVLRDGALVPVSTGAVNALINQLRKEEEKVQVDLAAGIAVS